MVAVTLRMGRHEFSLCVHRSGSLFHRPIARGGIRTAILWLRIHYPQRANTILAGACIVAVAAGVMLVVELTDQPRFRAHDLLTCRSRSWQRRSLLIEGQVA